MVKHFRIMEVIKRDGSKEPFNEEKIVIPPLAPAVRIGDRSGLPPLADGQVGRAGHLGVHRIRQHLLRRGQQLRPAAGGQRAGLRGAGRGVLLRVLRQGTEAERR